MVTDAQHAVLRTENLELCLGYDAHSTIDYTWLRHFKLCHNVSVVACQRYVCPNVISMTMNVIIQQCIIENCFIEPYV